MRWLFATGLVLHGIAHLVGFAVSWQFLSSAEVPYKTTLAGGLLNIGDTGMKAIGVLWLVLAIAFVASATTMLLGWRVALPLSLATIGASLVTCAISLPEARVGLAINVLLVLFLALGPRAGLEIYHDGQRTAFTGGALR